MAKSDRTPSAAQGRRRDTMSPATQALDAAFARLRRWSSDDLHAGQSAHFHQPVYANPAALRGDVRLVLDELVKARSK